MFPRGARVLVAVSGGPDSVALLHLLRILSERHELVVAGVAHFNHQLRGADADDDERFCVELAAAAGVPIEIGRGPVLQTARDQGRSVEDAARMLRYAFFREAALRLDAAAVAVGHSREDQAETFLLRLLRGAGAKGLSGIRPRAGIVVRPLLEISRAALRRYVADHGLAFREDASNADVRIPRNRIRHDLIPVLQQYSPAIAAILARQAEAAARDEEYLTVAAIELAPSVVLRTEGGVEIDAAALNALPAALAVRVVREALTRLAAGRFLGFQHIESVLDLARKDEPAEVSVSLPGQVATRRGGRIVLGMPAPAAFSNFFRFPLSIPGEVSVPGWVLSAQPFDGPAEALRKVARGPEVMIAAGPLRSPLAVRTRRKGDRFRPLGMGGRGRKLQDFLVDRKIARAERDALPLVVDRDDRIVWVVGQSVAEDFRVTEAQQGVILLKARRLGGVG
jgi:tRNA(Ile)-lysidine synthase